MHKARDMFSKVGIGSLAAVTMVVAAPTTFSYASPQTTPSQTAQVGTTSESSDVSWFDLAAKTIGITVDELNTGLDQGKTIAAQASAKGVNTKQVIDALVAADTTWINEQVAAGHLSQDEAKEYLSSLPEEARSFVEDYTSEVNGNADEAIDETNGWDALAAKALGITVDELYTGIEQGQTIAKQASAKSVDPQKVIDALVAADTTWVKERVAAGDLSQDEANEYLSSLPDAARSFVETYSFADEQADAVFDKASDWDALAAQALGISVDELYTGIEQGQTIAKQASAKSVDPQKVIDALVAADTTWVKEQVAAGAMSQDEATEYLKSLPDAARSFVETYSFATEEAEAVFDEASDWDVLAAKALGISVDEMYNGIGSGQTIAKQASAKGVDPQKVIDMLIDADTTWVKERVAAGDMSQDEANRWLADLGAQARSFVEQETSVSKA